MPRRTDISSIMIIGAGPIVIGQACEFDYSGAQACKALKEEGYRVILVNSNPATIMTDPGLADATYIEPITPDIVARISIADQEMTVLVDGEVAAVWPVSTARKGYVTPRGVFRPQALRRMHYSRKYDNAPMPFSVFFRGGYAIHATHEVKRLGRPASHGCVRLARQNAATLFRWIREHGPSRTRIIIS